MSATSAYEITATFQITGRGVAAVIEETVDVEVGRPLHARITRPDGSVIDVTAHQEWLLRRHPLVGLEESQVPIGSLIEIGAHAS